MPNFDNFTIELDPSKLAGLSSKIDSASRPDVAVRDRYADDAIQLRTVSDTINLVQQPKLIQTALQDPTSTAVIAAQADARDTYLQNDDKTTDSLENIYGKTASVHADKTKVAQAYKARSDADANRFENLTLELDDQKITITDLVQKAADLHNTTYGVSIVKKDVTMDMIVDYIQETHQVSISEKQRNFLRSQWDQASLQGMGGSFTAPGIRDQNGNASSMPDPNDKRTDFFIFKDGKLHSVKVSESIIGFGGLEGKSGKSSVTADISNLAGPASKSKPTRSAEDYLPEHAPKSVSINYESKDGLACSIHPDIHQPITEHAKFEGKEASVAKPQEIEKSPSRLTQLFTKVKEAVSYVVNGLKKIVSKFSGKANNTYTSVDTQAPEIKAKTAAAPAPKTQIKRPLYTVQEAGSITPPPPAMNPQLLAQIKTKGAGQGK